MHAIAVAIKLAHAQRQRLQQHTCNTSLRDRRTRFAARGATARCGASARPHCCSGSHFSSTCQLQSLPSHSPRIAEATSECRGEAQGRAVPRMQQRDPHHTSLALGVLPQASSPCLSSHLLLLSSTRGRRKAAGAQRPQQQRGGAHVFCCCCCCFKCCCYSDCFLCPAAEEA